MTANNANNGKRSNGNGKRNGKKSAFPQLSPDSPYREYVEELDSNGTPLPDHVAQALAIDATGMTPAPVPSNGKRNGSNGKKKTAIDASDAPSAPAPAPSKGKKTPAPAPLPSAPSKGKKTPAPSAPAPQYPSRAKAMMGAFDKLGDDAEEGKHFKLERNGSGFDLITLVPVGKSGGKKTPAPAPSAGKKTTPAPINEENAKKRAKHFEGETVDAQMLRLIGENPGLKVGQYRALWTGEDSYFRALTTKQKQGIMRASIRRLHAGGKIDWDQKAQTYALPSKRSNGKKTPAPAPSASPSAPAGKSGGKKTPAPAPAPAPAPSAGKRSRIRAK